MFEAQNRADFFRTPILNSGVSQSKTIEEELIPNIRYLVFRKCTPNWRIVKSEFPYWDITYVTAGSARYTIDGKEYDLSAGDMLCLPPGHIRSARTWKDNLMSCFAVNFTLTNMRDRPARLPFPVINHIGEQHDLIHLFHEMVFAWVNQPPLYLLKCRALFLLILFRLFEIFIYSVNSSNTDFRIKKIIRHIEKHYSEKLSVRKMAAILGLHPVYFGTLFKQETGMSMRRYLTQIRIKNAENMLRNGDYKVTEIAERCGYNDIFHFYKMFKQIYGFSPSECIPKKSKY